MTEQTGVLGDARDEPEGDSEDQPQQAADQGRQERAWRSLPRRLVLLIATGALVLGVAIGFATDLAYRVPVEWWMKDRYRIMQYESAPNGIWRLDTATGEVVLCLAIEGKLKPNIVTHVAIVPMRR